MKVMIFKNAHNNWEARSLTKNAIRFVGPMFIGFKTRKACQSAVIANYSDAVFVDPEF